MTSGDADLDEDGSRIRAMSSSECQGGGLLPKPDGPPLVEHRSSTTAYGGIGGWRVGPSHEGTNGWANQPTTYRVEIKADWTLDAMAKPFQVGQGTAWIQQTLTPFGTQIDKGGFP